MGAILHKSHALGFYTVAEGVNAGERRDVLHAMGCEGIQGLLLSRPVPAAELESWLQAV